MSDLIHEFGIDWKLLLAQAVNFGVLIFLLTKFAYRPILTMLAKRREDIERGVRFTREAEVLRDRAEAMNAEEMRRAQARALAVVTGAEETAKIRKEEIAAEAVRRGEAIIAEARRLIAQEKAKMSDAAYADAEDMIRSGIARVLGKMPAKERDVVLIREALAQLKSVQG
ncbi:MAG: hypothetical protein AAB533_01630 [Patescibacteria group bacterium]|mgnify:CR=1 FL=1